MGELRTFEVQEHEAFFIFDDFGEFFHFGGDYIVTFALAHSKGVNWSNRVPKLLLFVLKISLSFNKIEDGHMEDKTISLSANKILKEVFTPDVKGYDADQVDDFLDRVAKDYLAFEAYYDDSRKYIVDLETQLRKSREAVSALEVENAKLSKRLDGIKDSDSVTSDNIDLLQRISRLEKELFRLGVDPRKI